MSPADKKMLTALKEAKEAVGGNTALASLIGGGITPQAISQWKKVPSERALIVAKHTGVSVHRLRPDIFGKEEHAA